MEAMGMPIKRVKKWVIKDKSDGLVKDYDNILLQYLMGVYKLFSNEKNLERNFYINTFLESDIEIYHCEYEE